MKQIITLLVLAFFVHATRGENVVATEIGLPPISKSSGKIAVGTVWETDYFVSDSAASGATVLIIGGIHGNEPAGSHAAEQILHWPITSGKLIVVPRASALALEAKTRLTPNQPKEASNLNRNFPQAGQGNGRHVTPRGNLAAALWEFVATAQPDWVIDLHEGFEFNRSHQPSKGNKKSVGSSVIYRGGEEMDSLAERVKAAADATVTDPGRRFSLLRQGPVDTSLVRACIDVLGAEGMILETTFKAQPMSSRTRQHRAMVNVLLNHIGIIDSDFRNRLSAPKAPHNLQVAVYDGEGVGPSSIKLCQVIDAAQDQALFRIGTVEMQPELLEQFDVVVFPGGSGSKQANAIGKTGRTAVREYVNSGGGVVGVCAGAYLCSSHYDWSLDLIDAKVFTGRAEIPGKGRKQLWYRGKETDIDIELTSQGERLFADTGIPKNFVVRYANGPIISPKGLQALEDYRVLAWFRSENGLWKPQQGTMINTPAIVSGKFGLGRVMSISPHPELSPSLHPLITQAIRWTAAAVERQGTETSRQIRIRASNPPPMRSDLGQEIQ